MPELAIVDLLVFGVVVALILGFGTQVVLPIILGQPIFPFFRRRQKTRELRRAVDEVDELALDQEIREVRNRAERMRQKAPVVHIVDREEGGPKEDLPREEKDDNVSN